MDTLVIIGASNVTLSLPVIWAGLARAESAPQRLLVAAGHGRSFALPNTVLGRTLPSLLDCGLWETLAGPQTPEAGEPSSEAATTHALVRPLEQVAERREPSGPSTVSSQKTVSPQTPDGLRRSANPIKHSQHALITDVGNDLLYGASATQIAAWVRECVERLLASDVRPRLTHLPLGSLRSLSRRRFLFFRKLLFPSSTLTFETAIEQAEQLNAALVDLIAEFNLDRITPQPQWYGLDPIHIRRRARPEAWLQFLAPLLTDFAPRHPGPISQQRVWTKKAAVRWRGPREFVTPQPCLTEGPTELWLF